jgi:hypothetical protein
VGFFCVYERDRFYCCPVDEKIMDSERMVMIYI